MNIGSVIDRVQQIGDLLEKLIQQSNELRDRVIRLEENADETSDSVAVLDAKLDRQTALLERMAEERDLDPEAVYAEHDLDGDIEDIAGVGDEADGEEAETEAEAGDAAETDTTDGDVSGTDESAG